MEEGLGRAAKELVFTFSRYYLIRATLNYLNGWNRLGIMLGTFKTFPLVTRTVS